MNKLLKLTAALAALALVFSCTKTKVVELNVSPKAVSFEVAGGEQSVTITCNDAWEAVKDADWITLSAQKGEGDATLKITATANNTVERRDAQVVISAGEITHTVKVQQIGLEPELLVNPVELEVGCEGDVKDVTITSNIEWTVTIPEDAAWITVDKASGSGSTTIKVTVAANETVTARSAKIGVKGGNFAKVIDVAQEGEVPALAVTPTSVEATYEGKEQELTIVSNMPWTVVIPEDATWITSSAAEGKGDGKVTLTIESNIYRKTRSATVSFVASEDLKVDIAVAQDMAPISRQTDSLALVAIYNAIDAAGWKDPNKKWDLANKSMDQWAGIKLNDNGRVSQISTTAAWANALWELPEEIGDLTELTTLKLNKNVKGVLPASVYTLSKLEKFYFQTCELEGSLPEEIGQMVSLTEIYLDGNAKLQGPIPASIGQLTKLAKFNIAKTAISGAIPAELTRCTALTDFLANETQLSGEIPDSWSACTKMNNFTVNGNPGLTGPLPKTFGAFTSMKTGITINDCNFTGNIPEEWANIGSCTTMKLFGNKLKGVVPAAVQAHAKWKNWNPATNIFPQQEGFGLTDKAGSGGQDLDEETTANPWE